MYLKLKNLKLKNFLLFLLFYIFINLYLSPTFALCEIDMNLLDRENNTYKGSKIVYEEGEDILTEEDIKYAHKVLDAIFICSCLSLIIIIPLFFYSLDN